MYLSGQLQCQQGARIPPGSTAKRLVLLPKAQSIPQAQPLARPHGAEGQNPGQERSRGFGQHNTYPKDFQEREILRRQG